VAGACQPRSGGIAATNAQKRATSDLAKQLTPICNPKTGNHT
jgi:hypothetical protein